ncbi:MAG: D-glycerate dehydrogenase [Balneolales bacterium]
MKPKVFLTRELPDKVMEKLKIHTDLEMNTEDRVLTKQEIIDGIKGKDALLCLLTDQIDSEIMDANLELKIIANYAVGFNNVDIKAANERNIPVSNTPGVLTDTSADLAFALVMSVGRRVVEADKYLRTGKWQGWGPLQFLGQDISGSTLGIIGFGRIGKALAKRGSGFKMDILYWNRTRLPAEEEKELGVTYSSFERVFEKSDFVSVNVTYNNDTHHLVGKSEFELMNKRAYIINTSRGPVINEKELVEALKSGKLSGAGLDVFENEPQIEPELFKMDNVVILPHIASATVATRTRMGMIALENVFAALETKPIPNLVNKSIYAK